MRGARLARFHDDARGTVYLADLAAFREKGIRVDFGHGVQWVLPVKHWTQPGQDNEPTRTEPQAEQMGLFGEGAR